MNYSENVLYTRHGGAFDRGSADAWYGRHVEPHYYVEDTYNSAKVEMADMSEDEIAAYMAGYNQTPFAQKDWN
jgi:hypothetical protein